MYYVKHTGNKARLRLFLLMTAITLLTALTAAEVMLRQVVFDAAGNRVNAEFGRAVSRAALEAFPEETRGLTVISTDSDNCVTSVSVNSALASRINSNMALLTEQKMKDGAKNISIPIGSLTGVTLLNGKGPAISVKVTGYTGVHSELYSEFSDAGINQSLHRVLCRVSADALIISGSESRKVVVSSTVVLCETVIVGRVTGSYTIVNGDQSDAVGRVFDYGDPYGNDLSG